MNLHFRHDIDVERLFVVLDAAQQLVMNHHLLVAAQDELKLLFAVAICTGSARLVISTTQIYLNIFIYIYIYIYTVFILLTIVLFW